MAFALFFFSLFIPCQCAICSDDFCSSHFSCDSVHAYGGDGHRHHQLCQPLHLGSVRLFPSTRLPASSGFSNFHHIWVLIFFWLVKSISLCCFRFCFSHCIKQFSWIWVNPPWENWSLEAFTCWIYRFPLDFLVRCWWAPPFCRWPKMRKSLPCSGEPFCLDWVHWSSAWGLVASSDIASSFCLLSSVFAFDWTALFAVYVWSLLIQALRNPCCLLLIDILMGL